MNRNVIELVIFETKEDITEEQFIQLFYKLNTVLQNDIPGFVKRSLTKDMAQNKWIEMIWWKSMQEAHMALEKLPQLPDFQQYCSALKDDGTLMYHLEEKA